VAPPSRHLVATALLCGAVASLLPGCSASSPDARPTPSTRVVYRVDDTSTDTARVTTQVIEDGGAYRGRFRTLEGPPPGGNDLGGAAWDGERQYLLRPDGTASSVSDIAPGFTGADSNLDVALAAGETHGLVRRTGTDTVAGTPCTTWVSREPLDTSTWSLPTRADTTTSCVSADGRLLRDAWTLAGRLVRTRTAVSVGEGPSLDGTRLLGGGSPGPLPTTAPLEQVRRLAPDVLVKALGIPLPAAPEGFVLDRAAAVLQADATTPAAVEGGVLTFRSGDRLVVLRLERGLVRRLPVPQRGVRVRAGARDAWLSPGLLGLRLAFGGGNGLVADVTADLTEQELLAWAGAVELP
jgi:hypothetical protein